MHKERVIRIDDLDLAVNPDSDTEAAETVPFALDGKAYRIDLTKEHAAHMRATLGRYAVAGRRLRRSQPVRRVTTARARVKASPTVSPEPVKASPVAAPEPTPAAVRAWAKAQGLPVAGYGRLPRALVEGFRQAHAS